MSDGLELLPRPTTTPLRSTTTMTAPVVEASRSPWWQWLLLLSVPVVIGIVFSGLLSVRPRFYTRCLQGDSEEMKDLSRQFLNTGSRLINDIRNQKQWTGQFNEGQINGWLAEDFQANHADSSLPANVHRPRIAVDGDVLRLGFEYEIGPVSTVVQIAIRSWVPRHNELAIELDGAWAGLLPLPANHTRRVIEQIAHVNQMEVRWKRNGQRLLALLQFPSGYREIVLQRIDIADGAIRFEGVNGASQFKLNDYSPSAN